MENCIFCRIIEGRAPAKVVYEDESVVAVEDLNPQAPVHLLVIPKRHFSSVLETDEGLEPLIGHLYRVAAHLARENQVAEGYRVVVNTGAGAGQSVFHLHLHMLGGRPFHWPPG